MKDERTRQHADRPSIHHSSFRIHRSRSLSILTLAIVLLASCGRSSLVPTVPAPNANGTSATAPVGTGNVVVTIALPPPKSELTGLRVRNVNLGRVASVDVRASRPGSRQEILASPNPVNVTNNQATATLSLTAGTNQVITVTGLDRRGKEVPGAILKGVVTVSSSGSTTATINSNTTPTARVIEVLAGIDPLLATKVDTAQIQSLVNQITGTSPYPKPSQVSPQAIADAIATSGTVPTTPTSAMTLGTGTVTVHVVNATTSQPVSGAAVVVSDPLSAKGTTDSNGDVTLSNVAPGRWSVTAGGTLVPVTVGEVFVVPGQARAANPQPTVYQPQQSPTTSASGTIGPEGGTLSVPGVLDLIAAVQ